MKMYDKNGRMTIIAKAIFDANMERLRNGDNPLEIARSMKQQVQLVEYNGTMDIPAIARKGLVAYMNWQFAITPSHPMFPELQKSLKLVPKYAAYYEFPIYEKRPLVNTGLPA